MQDSHSSRRTVLKATGASLAGVTLAGCGSTTSDDPDDSDNGGDDAIAIDPGEQIEFDGQTGGWEGLAPSAIEGKTNPTLELQEGETYEIGWTQGDSSRHNIEIRDDSDVVVGGLETEVTSEPGDDQWLEFEASTDMTTYVCRLHATMVGDIEVV